jgi:hypothetical protein
MTSVAQCTIFYDIGYMSSSTSRTLERWKAGRLSIQQLALRATISFNCYSYLKTKIDTHLIVDNQMAELENEVSQHESPNERSRNA